MCTQRLHYPQSHLRFCAYGDSPERIARQLLLGKRSSTKRAENQTVAEDEERYFLVAEEGYLIVYDKGQETTDLFTHMPLAEFPAEEQERLMTGIWFPTMAEIFSYLESYSS